MRKHAAAAALRKSAFVAKNLDANCRHERGVKDIQDFLHHCWVSQGISRELKIRKCFQIFSFTLVLTTLMLYGSTEMLFLLLFITELWF